MSFVKKRLPAQDNKLSNFLKDTIDDLETDKREVVGVFGKTGSGKSFLINAVIGEMNLLPTGSVCACTSVMIEVKANTQNKTYQADIEFITKEAEKLSTTLVGFTKVTRRNSKDEEGKRWYWPLVKCVTIKVPNNDLLRHVTLVDLPGNGDRNKSRDNMWKQVVGSCSTVWIVTDIDRAAAEKEAWQILESASSLMGNGGECQHILFICSKSDGSLNNREAILDRNMLAKTEVSKRFSEEKTIKADKNTDVCTDLDKKMKDELDKVRKPMEEAYKAFEKCLSEGVERSKSSCESDLINERKCGPFDDVINKFSLDTEKLIGKYKDVELQLIFLKTEEDKIKTELNKIIRERKKTIYNSLTETIGINMQEGYDQAATFKGKDTLENMRDTLEMHVRAAKNIMFKEAKKELLKQLRDFMKEILEKLKKTMQKSIELSLKTDGDSIPDVAQQLKEVNDYYNDLKAQQQSP
ncbi:hypothetical protein PFLUV_G00176640 [Perca fluviatilis]|uniref:Dynamin N-terminal domain-containing protein n=1 Tax=Perca fluviatilis TaxID=8168 RepID=A0A6A5EKP6_PERFL|nr:hypothetical protein PFLUV_G00176640 [Perca fluviatilis]